jgi:hypothetical protein
MTVCDISWCRHQKSNAFPRFAQLGTRAVHTFDLLTFPLRQCDAAMLLIEGRRALQGLLW